MDKKGVKIYMGGGVLMQMNFTHCIHIQHTSHLILRTRPDVLIPNRIGMSKRRCCKGDPEANSDHNFGNMQSTADSRKCYEGGRHCKPNGVNQQEEVGKRKVEVIFRLFTVCNTPRPHYTYINCF